VYLIYHFLVDAKLSIVPASQRDQVARLDKIWLREVLEEVVLVAKRARNLLALGLFVFL
jgi:hypothetical protein